jgi:hypothetical protein
VLYELRKRKTISGLLLKEERREGSRTRKSRSGQRQTKRPVFWRKSGSRKRACSSDTDAFDHYWKEGIALRLIRGAQSDANGDAAGLRCPVQRIPDSSLLYSNQVPLKHTLHRANAREGMDLLFQKH